MKGVTSNEKQLQKNKNDPHKSKELSQIVTKQGRFHMTHTYES